MLAWWAAHSPLRPRVVTFSRDGTGVRCAKGLRILPDHDIDVARLESVDAAARPGGASSTTPRPPV